LEPEVLHKSKEAPNTGTDYISLSSSLFLMQRDRASSVVFSKRKALAPYTSRLRLNPHTRAPAEAIKNQIL